MHFVEGEHKILCELQVSMKHNSRLSIKRQHVEVMSDSTGFRTVPDLGYKQGTANKIIPTVKVEHSKIVFISERALTCNVLSDCSLSCFTNSRHY